MSEQCPLVGQTTVPSHLRRSMRGRASETNFREEGNEPSAGRNRLRDSARYMGSGRCDAPGPDQCNDRITEFCRKRYFVYSLASRWRATARIADLMIAGNEGQFATRSANSGSIAALFAAPFAESLDFSAESAIVRSLSWA